MKPVVCSIAHRCRADPADARRVDPFVTHIDKCHAGLSAAIGLDDESTAIAVALDADGSAVVVVRRDGRVLHRIEIEAVTKAEDVERR